MKGRVADNIETLKRYAQWLDANNREREDGPSEEANAILNLISVVGTLEARNKELKSLAAKGRLIMDRLVILDENHPALTLPDSNWKGPKELRFDHEVVGE